MNRHLRKRLEAVAGREVASCKVAERIAAGGDPAYVFRNCECKKCASKQADLDKLNFEERQEWFFEAAQYLGGAKVVDRLRDEKDKIAEHWARPDIKKAVHENLGADWCGPPQFNTHGAKSRFPVWEKILDGESLGDCQCSSCNDFRNRLATMSHEDIRAELRWRQNLK